MYRRRSRMRIRPPRCPATIGTGTEAAPDGLEHDLGFADIDAILRLTENASSSALCESANQMLRSSILASEELGAIVDNAALTQDWSRLLNAESVGPVVRQFHQMAKVSPRESDAAHTRRPSAIHRAIHRHTPHAANPRDPP